MTALGFIFISAGFLCWFVGAGKITKRAIKRLGIKRDWELNPVAPLYIPFRKLNGNEWWLLALVFVASTFMLNIGLQLLAST
jgi:hypothetical protein